jgi:hypothetical protein
MGMPDTIRWAREQVLSFPSRLPRHAVTGASSAGSISEPVCRSTGLWTLTRLSAFDTGGVTN